MPGDHTPLPPGEHPAKVERHIVLPYVPASAGDARHLLSADLRDLGVAEKRIDEAALIISELVGNALRHASPLSAPANSVGVSWKAEAEDPPGGGGRLEISVRDGGSATVPRVAAPGSTSLGGRGLGIIRHLAGCWGAEKNGAATTVWAVLDLPAEDAGRISREAGAAGGGATPAVPPSGPVRDAGEDGSASSFPFAVCDGGRTREAVL